MFLLSMALVEGLIKALKSVTLYQCPGCVGCAPGRPRRAASFNQERRFAGCHYVAVTAGSLKSAHGLHRYY